MCLAIHRPKGIKLDEEIYREGFRRNDHGGGFAYVEHYKDGSSGIEVVKGLMNVEAMVLALAEHEGKEMIIHFRRASAGGVSPANCHPFYWESKHRPQYSFALIHNGTLSYRSTLTKSDTACFVQDILEPHFNRDPFFLDSYTGVYFLEEAMGLNNKFVIMRYDKKLNETKIYILNEDQGEKDKGCWFSNCSYKPIPVAKAWTGYGGHGEWGGDDRPGYLASQTTFSDKKIEKEWNLKGWRKKDGVWVKEPQPLTLPTTTETPVSLVCMVMAKHVEKEIKKDQTKTFIDDAKRIDNEEAKALGKVIPFPELEATPKDPDMLEDEAWKKATGDTSSPLPKPIEVPRDADKKECPKRSPACVLNKKQKNRMRRLCEDYLSATNVPGWKEMHFMEQLSWLREDMRSTIPPLEEFTDQDLDEWLLAEVLELEVDFRKEKEQAKAEAAKAEADAKKAAEGVTT